MYSVIFADDKKFIFTKHQIMLIPYFNALLSSSFLEKDIINISSSSIGFEYIHIYATMDEVDIIDPNDKYLFVLKQCDYFSYDKLKLLLEQKYGYKIDITDIKEKTGKEFNIKLKYLGKINIVKRKKPILNILFEPHNNNRTEYNIDNKIIDIEGHILKYEHCGRCYKLNILPEYLLHTYFNKIYIKKRHSYSSNGDHYSCSVNNLEITTMRRVDYSSEKDKYLHIHDIEKLFDINPYLFVINPIYEYPEYSTDEEINEIFKKRYRKKYNTYFVKMFKNIILLTKDDIICVKIDDSYKLLTEITEDDYKNIESIIIEKEPKFNYKYFIKYIDDNYEIFENI
jgi:hypothetical protein